MRHLLPADDEHGPVEARCDGGVRHEERGGARRGRRLGAEARHAREPEVGRHVRREVPLADELLGVHRRDDQGVGPLEAGGHERAPGRLGHEIRQGIVPPPDPGHGRPRDVDLAHAASRAAEMVRQKQALTIEAFGPGPGAVSGGSAPRRAVLSGEPFGTHGSPGIPDGARRAARGRSGIVIVVQLGLPMVS